MNILILSWRSPKHPDSGGAEQVVQEHAKGWIKNGHKVTLFSAAFNEAIKYETLDKVKIIRFGNQVLGVHLGAIIWYLFLNKQKFDLVIDCFHGIPFFTPLYVRKPKKIAIIQEVTRDVWLQNFLSFPFNLILGSIGYLTEPLIFKLYRKIPIITGSKSTQTDLIRLGLPQKNISIIPHGILIKSIKPQTKNSKPTVVFLGALTKDKGIDDALAAFALLNNLGDFNFWVIGKASRGYILKIQKLLSKLKLDKKVRFFGYVNDQKKFELLAQAHILINPSIREGWGLVNLEANAVGTPVVAYRSPGLIDAVRHNLSGVIVKHNTPQSLADTIYKLINDPKKYKKLSQGAKEWSQQFIWENSCKMSLKLIESL